MTVERGWRKSTYSGGGEDNHCVELASLHGVIAIRESDVPGDILITTPVAFGALIRAVKAGALDDFAEGAVRPRRYAVVAARPEPPGCRGAVVENQSPGRHPSLMPSAASYCWTTAKRRDAESTTNALQKSCEE
jgi:Domain of unknown function (DUF397)